MVDIHENLVEGVEHDYAIIVLSERTLESVMVSCELILHKSAILAEVTVIFLSSL